MNDFDKYIETMKDLGIDTKYKEKYIKVSEYCALLSTLGENTEKVLIKHGGCVFSNNLSKVIIEYNSEKLKELLRIGNEILELLK